MKVRGWVDGLVGWGFIGLSFSLGSVEATDPLGGGVGSLAFVGSLGSVDGVCSPARGAGAFFSCPRCSEPVCVMVCSNLGLVRFG